MTYESKLEKNLRAYECVKNITKALRHNFKGIQSNSFGYCCGSDYDYHHKYTNENDFVCAKIYKGGLNNDYHTCWYDGTGYFDIGNSVYFMWCLTNFKLGDVINVMSKVASEYGYKIISPVDSNKCIVLEIAKSEG